MADTLETIELEVKHKATGADKQINNTAKAVKNLGKATSSTVKDMQSLANAFSRGATSALQNTTRSVSRFVNGALKNLRSSLSDIKNRVENAFPRLRTLFSSLSRIAFYRVIRTAIKEIGEAFKEGSENAYWYSRNFGVATHYISEAYDSLTASSFQMKNQLGAAWASMIAVIQPVIEQIIALVQRAAEAVTQFFAILSGKSTYLKAVRVAKQWADATDKGAKAAKEWRNQLLGFDEIYRLEAPSDSGSGKADDTPDYGAMFEEAPISNYMKDLMDAFKNGEWAELGKTLADKLNGLVDSIDWGGWGQKIGEKINAAIQTIYAFLKNVDFKNIGKSIAESLMGMMDAIDFETAGRLFVRKFTAMLDFIIGLVMAPGFWEKLAKSIGDFFHGAFLEAAEWLSENNLADVVGRIGQGILGILQRVAAEIKEHKSVFVEIGKQIGESLAAIPWKDILITIADIIWTVFKSLIIDGLFSTSGGKIFLGLVAAVRTLKLAFTVASPVVEAGIAILAKNVAAKLLGISTATAEAGAATAAAASGAAPAIAAGFGTWLAAIGGMVVGIPMYFKGVWGAIEDGLNWLNGMLITAGATITGAGIGAMIGALGGPIGAGIGALIGLAVGLITDGIVEIINNWDKIKEWWSATWSRINAWWNNTVAPFFSAIPDWFGKKFEQIKTSISDKINSVKETFGSLKDKVGEVVNAIADWFAELPNKIGYALGYVTGAIARWAVDVYNTLAEKIPQIVESVVNWFAELPDKILSVINRAIDAVVTWGQNMYQKFKTAIENIVDSIQKWFADLPKKIYEAIKKTVDVVGDWARDVINAFADLVPKIIDNVVEFFKVLPKRLWELGTDIVNGLIDGIKDAWQRLKSGVKNFVDSFVQGFKDAFGIHSPSTVFKEIGKDLVEGLKVGFEAAWNAFISTAKSLVSSLASTLSSSIQSAISTASSKLQGFVSSAKSSIDKVTSSIDSVVGRASSKLSSIVGSINGALNSAASFVSSTASSIKSSVSNSIYVSPQYHYPGAYFFADGGYPDQGQLFVAREQGPELVGSIGGRTAVASNDDILEGIRQGVYDAVSAAIGGGYGSQDIRVYLDGREIRASQRRLDRAMG